MPQIYKQKGFALIIALAILVLAIVLTSLLFAYHLAGGSEARSELEKQLASRAAEAGLRTTLEQLSQQAVKSYYSDPVESYYWYGGDLPNDPRRSESADGILAGDGETLGQDFGMDGLRNFFEPGFHLQGDAAPLGWAGLPFNTNLDASGDDVDAYGATGPRAVPQLRTENNGRFDEPFFSNCNGVGNGACLLGMPIANGSRSPLQFLGMRDQALGDDRVSSFLEETTVVLSPTSRISIPYEPLSNPDPAGDDYHPLLNPSGTEGRVSINGVAKLPTVENPELHWRRYVRKASSLGSLGEGNLEGYFSTRAVDTSSQIDLNGAPLLTARLLHALILTTGNAPGPITIANPSIGNNGRGIEAAFAVNSFPHPNLGNPIIPSLLDYPQYFLFPNRAHSGFAGIDQFAEPMKMPWRIAATQKEELQFFDEPVSVDDPDEIVILKYRNQKLGGRFQSVEQIAEARRANGSLIFDERSRDEIQRLAQYLTTETWRDPNTISRRNGEPLGLGTPTVGSPWGFLSAFTWHPLSFAHVDAAPWQDLYPNRRWDGGEVLADQGFREPHWVGLNFQDYPCQTNGSGQIENRTWYLTFRDRNGVDHVYYPDVCNVDRTSSSYFYNYDLRITDTISMNDIVSITLSVHLNTDYLNMLSLTVSRSYDYPGGANCNSGICRESERLWDRQAGQTDSTRTELNQDFALNLGFFNVPRGAQATTIAGRWHLGVSAADPYGWSSELNTNWNPFFIREFSDGHKQWRVPETRNGIRGWSPFSSRLYSRNPLPHRHGSYDFPYTSARAPYNSFDHVLHGDSVFFNFDATQKNFIADVDPYVPHFQPNSPANSSVRTTMLSEVGDYYSDHGLDQLLNTWSEGGRTYLGGEHYLSVQSTDSSDPTGQSRVNFDPNLDDFSMTSISLGRLSCSPGSQAFGMKGVSGSEGNHRFDPYPELGRVWRDQVTSSWHLDEDMPPAFATLYQAASDSNDPSFNSAQFLRPTFSSWAFTENPLDPNLPSGEEILLLPPSEARGNDNWFAEPGEPYGDHGRDGIPNTGDAGEGNGRWDPGEYFWDTGLDGVFDSQEQAFANAGLTSVLSNCLALGATAPDRDLHQDNFHSVRGIAMGSEGNNQFDLAREPFWDHGGVIRENFSTDPKDSNFFWDFYRYDFFYDVNSDGVYDHGVFREPRAPLNINSAPEETMAAVLYQALMVPIRKRHDRFMITNWDHPNGTTNRSLLDDYNWNTVVVSGGDWNAQYLQPDMRFAYHLSRSIARAIQLRRLGLYYNVSGQIDPELGAGPFRSWTEYDTFIRALLRRPAETARFDANAANTIQRNGTDYQGTPLLNPFAMYNFRVNYPGVPAFGYPAGDEGLRDMIADRLLVQANPNTRMKSTPDAEITTTARFEKTDFPFPTTEFCFGPTGYYEITTVGYSAAGTVQEPTPSVQVVGAGYSEARPDLLSSHAIRAQIEHQQIVKVFEHQRLSTLADFAATEGKGRGVSSLPHILQKDDCGLESSISVDEWTGANDWDSANANAPLLIVKPRVTCFDPARGLIFVASGRNGLPLPGGVAAPIAYDSSFDPGSTIQILSLDLKNDSSSKLSNEVRNNGISRRASFTGRSELVGLIEPGNGMSAIRANITAMSFDPNFPAPRFFQGMNAFLGRLYFLDENSHFLRAIDLGRDSGGGLVSVEASFATNPSFSGSAIKVILAPERREILTLEENSAEICLRRFRYPDGTSYPALDAFGRYQLQLIDKLTLGHLPGTPTLVEYERHSGNLFLGLNENNGGSSSMAIYAVSLRDALQAEMIFPWSNSVTPLGYESITGLQAGLKRELVGLALDSSSNLLFALWNNLDGSDPNGRGAYLAAIPVGAAPYITVPLANPFPMELTLADPTNPALRENDMNTVQAAGMALDTRQKTLLILPREQQCSTNAPYNPFVRYKNLVKVACYRGDGIRIADLIHSIRLWTDAGSYVAGQPAPIQLQNFDGKNLFFAGMEAPQVTSSRPHDEQFGQPFDCDSDPKFGISRSIRLLKIRGIPFLNGNEIPLWQDGGLVAKGNALPLSAFSSNPNSTSWIRSRANFDTGPFFVEPQYRLRDTDAGGPKVPLSLLPVYSTDNNTDTTTEESMVAPGSSFTYSVPNNGIRMGEGLIVDEKAPFEDNSRVFCPPTTQYPQGRETDLLGQRYYFGQEALGRVRTLRKPLSRPRNGIVENNIENGWSALEGGTEFWIRFSDLRQIANFNQFSGANGKQIVLYRNLNRARAELTPRENNPFLVGDTDQEKKESLFNILKADEKYLNSPEILPVGMTATSIVDYDFCPDALDLWAEDRISLEQLTVNAQGKLTASIVFDRRLAAPVGHYPSITIEWPKGATQRNPWGIFQGCESFYPASTWDSLNWEWNGFNRIGNTNSSIKNSMLNNLTERTRYGKVKVVWNNGATTYHRFAPIFSNGDVTPASHEVEHRQAATRAKVEQVVLDPNSWIRIAFASQVDFDPAHETTALMIPSRDADQTTLLAWTESQGMLQSTSCEPIHRTGDMVSNYFEPSWMDFRSDYENGSLSFTGYAYPLELVDTTPPNNICTQRVNQAAHCGPIIKGLSYTVDDIVFYHSSDPILEIARNPSHPLAVALPRYENPEGGFIHRGATLEWQTPTATTYLAAEPFFDFNSDGVRNAVNDPIDIWDFNRNGRWDFGETQAFLGDNGALFGTFGVSSNTVSNPSWIYGEPYADLSGDHKWNSNGDILVDLNFNGVLDGEPYEDQNGNRVYDPGEPFDDYNRNGQFDGGEPFIPLQTAATRRYNPRYGESFSDQNGNLRYDLGEPFFDENRNGLWSPGEPFVSWSRTNSPVGGELYRENGLLSGFEFSNYNFPAAGSSWNSGSEDWNHDGSFASVGDFSGKFPQTITAGSKIGSLSFNVRKPPTSTGQESQGHISIDLELRAKDGRVLGSWVGIDNIATNLSNKILQVDESGIGLPVPTDAELHYRIHFVMPSPVFNPSGDLRPCVSPILDDLSLTVVLPSALQSPILDREIRTQNLSELERGWAVQ